MTMEHHPAASIFPLMEGDEFEEFMQDIKENGQKQPIITYEGRIIDGRNRDRALRQLGRSPVYMEWDGKGNLTEYVVSLNLHRRHLTTNQRAMLGAKIRESLKEESRQRMAKTQFSANPAASVISCYPQTPAGKSSEHAAAAVKTSAFNVEKASFVCNNGSPELIAAVQAEQVAVHNAADLAKLPHEEQRAIVAQGPEVMLEKAREIRQQKSETPAAPGKKTPEKPIATRGLSAVAKYLDGRVEHWTKKDDPHAEAVFTELRLVRKELCGR
jgi:hypothetical protein